MFAWHNSKNVLSFSNQNQTTNILLISAHVHGDLYICVNVAFTFNIFLFLSGFGQMGTIPQIGISNKQNKTKKRRQLSKQPHYLKLNQFVKNCRDLLHILNS